MFDPTNHMHVLRRFGREHLATEEPVTLSAEQARFLASGVVQAMKALDQLWEAASGRALTPEEKGER